MGMKSFFLIISLSLASLLNGQVLDNFSGHWTGLENLDSPSLSYDNRNISIVISEGGDREDYFIYTCLLYTSPSPRDGLLSRMPSSA